MIITPKMCAVGGRFTISACSITRGAISENVVTHLSNSLDKDTYIVGVEPSCVAVFRDELKDLFPDDPKAQSIGKRTFLLGEFLAQHSSFKPPSTERKFIVHGHCHQKSVLGMQDDEKLLKAASSKVEMLDSGCCGMAGSFGYEKDKYPVSLTIANQVLLPAIKNMGTQDILVASGFSCRTQIAQLAGRQAWTMPEVLAGLYERGGMP